MTDFNEGVHRKKLARLKTYYARLRKNCRCTAAGWQQPHSEIDPFPEDLRDLICGAKTRKGTPCKITTLHSGMRCRFHGGLSTGAKTRAGKKRQREGYLIWLKKKRASKAGRKRTRTFISDICRLDGVSLAEVSARAPGCTIRTGGSIRLYFTGDSLIASLPDGKKISVKRATTQPQYGGFRWWYVCPVCQKRRTALYLSDSSMQCRQCAGLHYRSQSKLSTSNTLLRM
ncbi:HGGxSTG domain-containing protein [Pantoea stewartii]|uniref:HGGxSTG domain-containing protein n=1 Tax=Pantoea stewartii TaxID=66269 RepID=UPI0016262B4F|nr:HGGxSTG domain-containing protein [Pantoea stewartii]MBC0852769.1 hypothetical protein [Pantoea stewartii]